MFCYFASFANFQLLQCGLSKHVFPITGFQLGKAPGVQIDVIFGDSTHIPTDSEHSGISPSRLLPWALNSLNRHQIILWTYYAVCQPRHKNNFRPSPHLQEMHRKAWSSLQRSPLFLMGITGVRTPCWPHLPSSNQSASRNQIHPQNEDWPLCSSHSWHCTTALTM